METDSCTWSEEVSNEGGRIIMQLTSQQFDKYEKEPLKFDSEMRSLFKIPQNKYYSVSIWPSLLAGRVCITSNLTRNVPINKISKSIQ